MVKNVMAIILVLALGLGGCSAISGVASIVDAAGGKAHAFCTEGSGPPLTGAGKMASAKVAEDFKGTVSVGPECALDIKSE